MRLRLRLEKAEVDRLIRRGSDMAPYWKRLDPRLSKDLFERIDERLHGDPLDTRSGGLRKAWRAATKAADFTARRARIIVECDSPYARIHNEGGMIRPRRARMLAIPIGPELTGRGVARHSSPRDVPGLFQITSRAGNILLVRRTRDGIEPHFVLKERVEIPARRYLDRAINRFERTSTAIVEEEMERYLRGAAA